MRISQYDVMKWIFFLRLCRVFKVSALTGIQNKVKVWRLQKPILNQG